MHCDTFALYATKILSCDAQFCRRFVGKIGTRSAVILLMETKQKPTKASRKKSTPADQKAQRKEDFLNAYRGGKIFSISSAAKKAGVTRQTVWNWAQEDEDFRNKIAEIREEKIDFVEDKMWKSITAGDSSMIRFFLSTIGRRRGYGIEAPDKGLTNLKQIRVSIIRNREELEDADDPCRE